MLTRQWLSLISILLPGLSLFIAPAFGQNNDDALCPGQGNNLPAVRPNILLIIADDLGVDCVGAYREHPDPGRTPVINSLAKNGLLFRNAWSCPGCSPTRAAMLTGRYPFRTGVGFAIEFDYSDFELSVDEPSIPKIIGPSYRTAAVGKWHLSAESISAYVHPLLMGFEHHRGAITNLPPEMGEQAYFNYEKSVDGRLTQSTVYATTDSVNDALDLIDSFGEDPWFIWLAFNTPHGPYHKPPANLHTYNLPSSVWNNRPVHMRAMAEAMDTEIGRLLDSMDPEVHARTVVIFVADNGTTKTTTLPPFLPEHSKGTTFEGGVNVPLIVSGPGVVEGAECQGLVHLTDIFATAAALARVVPVGGTDSISLTPYFKNPDLPSLRPSVFTERFKANGFDPYYSRSQTVRNDHYKLIYFYDQYSPDISETLLFDLVEDPFEQDDLLLGPLTPVQKSARRELTKAMQDLGF